MKSNILNSLWGSLASCRWFKFTWIQNAVRQINRKNTHQEFPTTHTPPLICQAAKTCPEAGRAPWGSITLTPTLCLYFPLDAHCTLQSETRQWKSGVRELPNTPADSGLSKPWQCQGKQQDSHKEHVTMHTQQEPAPQQPITIAILDQDP